MIRLENVSKVYHTAKGDLHALKEVTLEIAAGEFVAVCGPSGCGKSTLLSLIGGLAKPTAGRIEVAGQEISHLPPGPLAHFSRKPHRFCLSNVPSAALFGRTA